MRIGMGCVGLGTATGRRTFGDRRAARPSRPRRRRDGARHRRRLRQRDERADHRRAMRHRRDVVELATKGGYVFRPRSRAELALRREVVGLRARLDRSPRRRPAPAAATTAATARQDFSPGALRRALEASLRRLRTDHVDVYQLHGPPDVLPDVDADAAAVRRRGQGRDASASAPRISRAPRRGPASTGIDVIQLPVGVLDPHARTVVPEIGASRPRGLGSRRVRRRRPRGRASPAMPRSRRSEVRRRSTRWRASPSATASTCSPLAYGFVRALAGRVDRAPRHEPSRAPRREPEDRQHARPLSDELLGEIDRHRRTRWAPGPVRRERRAASSSSAADPRGAIAAARLVERGLPVTMLDAGTHAPRGLLVKVAGKTVVPHGQRARARRRSHRPPRRRCGLVLEPVARGVVELLDGRRPAVRPVRLHRGSTGRRALPVAGRATTTSSTTTSTRSGCSTSPPGTTRSPGVPANRRALLGHGRLPAGARSSRGRTSRGTRVGVLPMAKGAPWMIARRARSSTATTASCCRCSAPRRSSCARAPGSRGCAGTRPSSASTRSSTSTRRTGLRRTPAVRGGGRRGRRDRLDGAPAALDVGGLPQRARQQRRDHRALPPRPPREWFVATGRSSAARPRPPGLHRPRHRRSADADAHDVAHARPLHRGIARREDVPPRIRWRRSACRSSAR